MEKPVYKIIVYVYKATPNGISITPFYYPFVDSNIRKELSTKKEILKALKRKHMRPSGVVHVTFEVKSHKLDKYKLPKKLKAINKVKSFFRKERLGHDD